MDLVQRQELGPLGSSVSQEVAISRTTMFVQSHWSVLKRLYLLPCNKPRVDLLIYVIDTHFVFKFENDFNALKEGIKKPCWWKAFRSECE